MVKKYAENGMPYHEPPYTPEEERDFYRRVAGGPVTVLNGPARPRPQKEAMHERDAALKAAQRAPEK